MRSNSFDDNFKKKKALNLPFVLRIIVIIFAILIMVYLFFFIFNIKNDNSYEIDVNGEKYGTSKLVKYQGKAYYKGEVLPNADLNTLKNVDGYNEYFVDKENVYYKSKLLPIKNSGKLIVVSSEQGDEFLYEEASGYVFIGDYSFDRDKAPYKVIGNNGNHLYNLIFVAKDGVYFYNSEKKKQIKAGDNIFVGNIEEITPNIFTDDKNIYYFSAYSIRSGSRMDYGTLLSRNTDIYYLDEKDGWEKVTDIRDGIVGAIWQKGNKYYYFDNLGIFHSIDKAVYEISDKETLDYLLSKVDDKTDDIQSDGLTAINTDYIEKLIKDKKLIAVSGKKEMTATIKYEPDTIIKILGYLKIIFLSIGIILIIFEKYKKFRKKKDDDFKYIKK